MALGFLADEGPTARGVVVFHLSSSLTSWGHDWKSSLNGTYVTLLTVDNRSSCALGGISKESALESTELNRYFAQL